ncbi:MAG: glycosyltransferase [Eubacterium sp.]|nr:glycosyltransferase [Eubacterium sp.]
MKFLKKKAKKTEEKKKTEGPLVSVVIPLYNHEKYIQQAIQSVLSQTYQSWELLIVDDGSKDLSVKKARAYTDKRIQLYEQENEGAHRAINRGLSLAKGEYLAILNSDDLYEPERLSKMVRYLQEHQKTDFACTYLKVINEKGKLLGIKEGWKNMEPWLVPHPEQSLKDPQDFKANLIMANFISTTSNFLVRRRLYEKIGGMRNLRFAHDWDFALRAAEVAECAVLEEPLLQYRVHSANTITSDRKWMLFEIAWVWAANLKRFYQNEPALDAGAQIDIVKIAESLNLQGNDKVFWMILIFIEAGHAKGIQHPEEQLLDDAELRSKFLRYVEGRTE